MPIWRMVSIILLRDSVHAAVFKRLCDITVGLDSFISDTLCSMFDCSLANWQNVRIMCQ